MILLLSHTTQNNASTPNGVDDVAQPPFSVPDLAQSLAHSIRAAVGDFSRAPKPLGWAEIRHPFHPLRGQHFEVLKKRRVAGVDTLILRELERGSFSVAREWTDWADPSLSDSLGFPPRRLDAELLLELATLLEVLINPK
jgi:hypothetical protein